MSMMYRELYKKRQPVEEQFLLRIEAAILLLENRKESEYKEKVFNMTKRAVECTVSENLYTDLSQLLLAPAELEAFILCLRRHSNALFPIRKARSHSFFF